MAINSQVPQGSNQQQVNEKSQLVFISGIGILPNDSPQVVTYLSGEGGSAIHLNIESNGDLSFLDSNTSTYKVINKENIVATASIYTDNVATNTLNTANAYTDSQVVAVTGASFGGSVIPTSNPSPTVDTFYFATAPGTYTNMGGVVVNTNSFAVISYKLSTTTWSITQTALDLSNYLTISNFQKAGSNILTDTYYILNKRLITDGSTPAYVGGALYDKVPFSGTTLEIGGWNASATTGHNFYWYDVSNVKIGSVILLNTSYPNTDKLTRPSNATSFSFNDVQVIGNVSSHGTLFARELILGGEQIKSLNNIPFMAKTLSSDNKVPSPTTDDMAVNRSYLNSNALLKTDITTELQPTGNLFDPTGIIQNTLINTSGVLQTSSNWQTIKISIPSGTTQITIGRINSARASLYGRFADNSDALIGTRLTYIPNGAATTFSVVSGTAFLYLTIKSPDDPNTNGYSQGTINTGSSLLTPYQPAFIEYVTAINSKLIKSSGGGESYDQSLNTTDNVEFESIVTPILIASTLVIESFSPDLPLWDGTGTPPVGLNIGDVYINSTTGINTTRLI